MLDTINTVAKSDGLLIFYCYDPAYGLSPPTMTIPMAQFNHELLKSESSSDISTLFIFDRDKSKLTISNINADELPFSFYSYVVGEAPITVTEITDINTLLDFFFEPVSSGGGTSDNGTYLAYISYNGDNNPLNIATLQSLTINGDDYSGLSVALDDWSVLSEVITDSLTSSGITNTGVLVSKGLTGDISTNTGTIVLYIQVFYPSAALSFDMAMLINGELENFSFNKIPTV